MSFLTKLEKINTRSAKRLGRGGGSGKGFHTVGRGQKGQKTRGTMPVWFEGGQLPIIRRTPFIKGKHRFQSIKPQPTAINLDFLNKLAENTIVDAKLLSEKLKLSEKEAKKGFKIVATGNGAIKLIEKSGGKYTFSK